MEIARIEAPPPAVFLRDYVEASRPAILRGLVETWPAFRLWSADYIRERYGDHRVRIGKTHRGMLVHDPWKGIRLEETGVRRAVDLVSSDGEYGYYVIASLEQYLGPLHGDIALPEYCRGQVGLERRIWISSAGTGTPLHRDFSENLLAQITGRKRVILYPPHDTPLLYAFPSRSHLPNFSAADAERMEDPRFPLLREAQRIEVAIEPGDMLYLPSRWWHQVRSMQESISVNFWWAAGLYRWMARASQAYQWWKSR
jgi:hypothetical protein